MHISLDAYHRAVRHWYAANGRHDLPWRHTDDAYRILVSELMLQQTQVNTVLKRYYAPFLTRFPTLKALRDASLDEVLKAWEGLGYYRRAKYLHAIAQRTLNLPCDIDALQRLPGIGKNTAHALAAFACRKSVPVMEANVRRILSRLFALEAPKEKRLWELAYALVDKADPFDYNQAMMDIGATVCTAKNPACDLCPLQPFCKGKTDPSRYPAPKPKRTVPTRRECAVVHMREGKVAMIQNSGAFLHGLWGFPRQSTPPKKAEKAGTVRHAYSHFKLVCDVYLSDDAPLEACTFVAVENIPTLALSKADEKIWKLVNGY